MDVAKTLMVPDLGLALQIAANLLVLGRKYYLSTLSETWSSFRLWQIVLVGRILDSVEIAKQPGETYIGQWRRDCACSGVFDQALISTALYCQSNPRPRKRGPAKSATATR